MTTSLMSREPVFDENAISREIIYQKEGSKIIDWPSPNGEIYRLEILPTVYPPREDTDLLAKMIKSLGPGRGRNCLEIGCGSGVLSAFSARMGWRVSACDINPYAVATARNLASQLGLNISVYEGGPGPEDEQSFSKWSNNQNYDLIFWNLPYLKYDTLSETLGPMEEAALLDTDDVGLFQRALYSIEKYSLIKDSGLCLFLVGDQIEFNELQKQSAKCNFAARQIDSLTFDNGETIHLIATWKPFVNAVHEHIEKIDSTSDELLKRNSPVGSSISANFQTKGHGRKGREWINTQRSFASSWVICDTIAEEILLDQIICGLAVKNSILCLKPNKTDNLFIKWPNDVLLNEGNGFGKLSGLLIESATIGDNHTVILGVGVNLSGTNNSEDFTMSFLDNLEQETDFSELKNIISVFLAGYFEDVPGLPAFKRTTVMDTINQEIQKTFNIATQVSLEDNLISKVSLTDLGYLEITTSEGRILCDDGDDLIWEF